MKCLSCECTYRKTSWHTDNNFCPDCSGTTEDLSIPDEEMRVDLNIIYNPTGKVRSKLDYDNFEE